MFSLNLPGVIMRTDVVSNIWNLLHEANQALGEFRVTSLTSESASHWNAAPDLVVVAGACRDDLPRRNIFEGPLGFQKAYSVVSVAYDADGDHSRRFEDRRICQVWTPAQCDILPSAIGTIVSRNCCSIQSVLYRALVYQ